MGPDQTTQIASIAPTPPSALPLNPSLRILLLSDLHLPLGSGRMDLLLANRRFLDEHDWVMLLGDLTACYGTPAEYRHVNRFLRALNRPYGVVHGNHEFFFHPHSETSRDYGRVWQPAIESVQSQQLQRFAQFFQLPARYNFSTHALAGVCMIGLDHIAGDGRIFLLDENEKWLAGAISECSDLPLVVFSHVPIMDSRLDDLRHYVRGHKPYYVPSPAVEEALRKRSRPVFWFSGHLHFGVTHLLFAPYQTQMGVWQVHCPDACGMGRPNNEKWHTQKYDGLFVRSIELDSQSLRVITSEVTTGQMLDVKKFDLNVAKIAPAEPAYTPRK